LSDEIKTVAGFSFTNNDRCGGGVAFGDAFPEEAQGGIIQPRKDGHALEHDAHAAM
jgi:hypothetical protein